MACRRRDFGDDQRMRLELDRGLTEEAFALAEDDRRRRWWSSPAHTPRWPSSAPLPGCSASTALTSWACRCPMCWSTRSGPRLGEGLALPLAQPASDPGRSPQQVAEAVAAGELSLGESGRRRRASWRSGWRAEGDRRIAARRGRAGRDGRGARRPADALGVRDRRHRQHPRGCPPGSGGGPGRRRRDRGHPLHGAEPARLRALRRDDGGVRRHLRDAGELPARSGGTRRGRSPRSGATSA